MTELRAQVMEIFSSIQGEGMYVGERHLFVRFYGCNRSCAYCDTPGGRGPVADCRVESSPGSGEFREVSNPLSLRVFVELVRERLRPSALHRFLVLTGGEPLLHAPFVARALPELSETVPVMLETNGTLPDSLREVRSLIAAVSMDIKLASATGEAADWEAHGRFLEACRGIACSVKAVITPAVKDEEMDRLVALLAERDPAIPLFLQPVRSSVSTPGWGVRLLKIQSRCLDRLAEVRVIPQIHGLLGLP